MLWLRIIALCFDKKRDTQARVWLGFSTAWTIYFSWQDSLMPNYDPANVPPDHILWNLAPWAIGLVVFLFHRLLFPELYRD